uniref:Uncharacterized protein n=1 Tax=Neogobius melanostomus TaxID=47308 RepID=A0A8C6TU82_9GOBI
MIETRVSCVYMKSCVLPCSVHRMHLRSRSFQIYWNKINPKFTPVYSFTFQFTASLDHKNPYDGRARLFNKQLLSKGNFSLLLIPIQTQDQGTYGCFIKSGRKSIKNTLVHVDVQGMYVLLQEDGESLKCVSRDIFPKPSVSWIPQRDHSTSVTPSETGLFSVLSSVPLTQPRQESTPPCPRPKAGLLLDQAKVLGNQGFRVWTRMKRLVTYQPVVLDPNTACPLLSLSDDLSTVRNTGTWNKELPEVPERFRNYAIVLGSVGYSSGTHQWDVEVRDHPNWDIGVAKESIEKKEKSQASLVNGSVRFGHYKGKYHNGSKYVDVKKSPEKIRVKLDFNTGTLSFSDADHMTPLCSHTVPKGTSTNKLFPYFGLGPAGGAETKELRIFEVQSEDSQSMGHPLTF